MSKFKLGDDVIWAHDLTDSTSIRGGTITKISGDGAWVDWQHKPEDFVYLAYLWPARVKEELASILDQRKELKQAYDNSMKLIYELQNSITRGEK